MSQIDKYRKKNFHFSIWSKTYEYYQAKRPWQNWLKLCFEEKDPVSRRKSDGRPCVFKQICSSQDYEGYHGREFRPRSLEQQPINARRAETCMCFCRVSHTHTHINTQTYKHPHTHTGKERERSSLTCNAPK